LCYPASSNFVVPPAVRLTDQFGVHDPVPLTPTSPQMLCNPVDKTLEQSGPGGPAGTTYPVSQPLAHLYCFGDATYQLDPTSSSIDAAGYDVQNQFGTFHVNPLQPTQLCLPSWKYDPNDQGILPGSVPPTAWADPSALQLNHFQCYSVNVPNPAQILVTLKDQFAIYPHTQVQTAAQLCAPVVKQVYATAGGSPGLGSDTNSDGVTGAHLLCFNIAAPTGIPRSPLVGNQFSQPAAGGAPTPIQVSTGQPTQLCLPSFKVPTTSNGTPEVSFVLLLPILGLAVGGGAVYVSRRRVRRETIA
jgi:hypothetical protein